MALPDRKKLTPGELTALGFGPKTERYYAPNDPRAIKGTISRRQAENDNYTAGGWRNRSDYERRYQGKLGRKYQKFEEEARENGLVHTRVARPGSQFSKLWNAYRAAPSNRRPSGPLAKLLIYIGLRPEDADYPVGSTPPSKR